MCPGTPPKSKKEDRRAEYYWSQVRRHGLRFREFHWPSAELLLNLAYTFYGIEACLARETGAYGLSLSAFNALMILSRSASKGCPLHELSELLLVSRANITGLVDSLVRKGLAERIVYDGDRRVRIARITNAGDALLESLLPGYFDKARKLCAGLNGEEKKALTELLTQLRRSAQKAVELERNAGRKQPQRP